MKRPEGFDRPPEPPPPAGRQPRPGKPARAAREASRNRATQAEATSRAGNTETRADSGASEPQRAPRIGRATGRRPRDTVQDARKAEERAQRRLERAERRRFTRRSRRRRITGFAVAGVFAALLAILAVAIFSPLLALRTVRVDGTKQISASSVRSAVSGQLGTPLALINQGTLRSELGKFTLIRSYSTSIVPPHTLVIHVVERQAIGVLKHGKLYDQVDAAGVVLAQSATPAGLPVIDVRGARQGSAAFQSVVRVLLVMPASVAHLIQTATASTRDDVSLTLAGTTNLVVWGSADQSDLKALDLSRLLAQPTCKAQAVIDVSAPAVATCGPVRVQPTPAPTSSATPNP